MAFGTKMRIGQDRIGALGISGTRWTSPVPTLQCHRRGGHLEVSSTLATDACRGSRCSKDVGYHHDWDRSLAASAGLTPRRTDTSLRRR